MQFKPVPPAPDSLEYVETARRGVPLTPGAETDCCQRLMDRAGVPAQDDAKTWLTFLRALGLAEETSEGKYVRTREPRAPDREYLASKFEDRVYAVDEILAILEEDGPLSAEATFEAFRPSIPQWERQRHEEFERIWCERIGRILDWAVLLGLATVDGDRYDRTR